MKMKSTVLRGFSALAGLIMIAMTVPGQARAISKTWVPSEADGFLSQSLSKPGSRTALDEDFEEKLFYHRAFEAVLWANPAADTLVVRKAALDMGLGEEALFITKGHPTGKLRVVTFNASVPYCFGTFTTKNAPLVMEIPPAMGTAKFSGSIFDLWYFPMVDIGPMGYDQGKGAKYILLPPDWGEKPVPDGYIPLNSNTYHVHMMFRGLSDKEGDAAWSDGYEYMLKNLKVYKYLPDGPGRPFEFHDIGGGPFEGTPAFDLSYYQYLEWLVQEEAVLERDKTMMGLLADIGFQKGKSFTPTGEQKRILEKAARDAQSWMVAKMEKNEAFGEKFWPDRVYRKLAFTPEVIKSGAQWDYGDRVAYAQRAYEWHYYGIAIQKKVGAAATYLTATIDSEGKPLDGKKTYKINLPPNVPIDDFWEVIGYSTWTRSFIDTEANRININSKQKLKVNDDGSIDVYIGPKPPEGMESNWISTRPDEGYFIGLRFYGPQKALYDLEWTPSDPEQVE